MATEGALGEPPSWWGTLAAARYLGVAPWELGAAPLKWKHRAIAAMDAEAHAREVRGSG